MIKKILALGVLIVFSIGISGCAVSFYKASPRDKLKIRALSSEVERLEELRAEEAARLKDTMRDLEQRLGKEIKDKQVRLKMAERGLVITFVAEVLFDSGKAEIKEDAFSILNKVAKVIRKRASGRDIGVEGHTDNVPIVHSGWKSNWELSTARATSVLHYLINKGSLQPERLSAIGYGEYRSIAPNETEEGRQLNRRVEVVVLPKTIEKLRAEISNEGVNVSGEIK